MSALRTQIRVKCSEVARNALGTEWATLDLTPEFSFRLSKDVQALNDVNSILTDGVLPFSVPFSTTNDLALGRFGSPVVFDRRVAGIEARAHVDGHELPFDTIFFRQKDSNRKFWEMEFRRSPNHWLELASDKRLCTIECGADVLSQANVEAGWAQPKFDALGAVTSIVRWWPVDFGGWSDLSEPVQFTDPPVKGVWLEDLRPMFSVPELLKRGFCEIGWTLEGLIFETAWCKALWQYILKRDYFTESRGGDAILITSNVATDFEMDGVIPVPFTSSVDYDPGTNVVSAGGGFYYPAIENPLPFKVKIKFCFKGFLENTTGSDVIVDGLVTSYTGNPLDLNWGGALTDPNPPSGLVTVPAGETVFADICLTATMEAGQKGLMLFGSAPTPGFFAKKGYRITIQPDTQSLVRGDVPELRKLIDCDYTLLGFLKGFLHLTNGRVKTDWNTRTLYVYPHKTADIYGDATQGFVDEAETIDLSGRVVCDSVRLTPVKNDLKRYTRLSFADTTDAYITELDPLEPPHSRKVLNGLDLADAIEERQNPFWEPTVERRSDELKLANLFGVVVYGRPYLPVMADNLEGLRSFNTLPRILFAYGVVGQATTEPNTGGKTGFLWEGAEVTEFGYASQARTLELDSAFPPHLDGAVVFGTLPSDLYVTFYIGLSQTNKRGMWADLLVSMGMNEWQRWDFRQRFLFSYEGRPLLGKGENIRDFAPGAETPTPMRVLIEPNDPECCDQPCSCRFTECDYFQDLGQFILQSTIDELSITSFKVDGVEQLGAAIELGIINVVSINGKAFVTNLVDALNGAEIPYFSFKPSERDYPEKTDLRFFKIKRPSCQSFEIIISDGDGAVYRYTDAEMGTKWFSGGDYEPFGYDENPISEPLGCVVTVEY